LTFDLQKIFGETSCLSNTDKNNEYYTRRRMHVYEISLNSLEREMFRTNLLVNPIYTFYVQKYFYEIRGVYEMMWKNMVKPDRP